MQTYTYSKLKITATYISILIGIILFSQTDAIGQNGFQVKLPCFRPRGIVPAKGNKTFGVANFFKNYYPAPGIDSSAVFMLDAQGNMVWSQPFGGIYVERYNVYSDTARGRCYAVATCGGSNYYETQQTIGVYCFSDSGRLVWSQSIVSNTSFCQTDLAIDSATGDLFMGALEGSVLLIDIIAGRIRNNCLFRISATTGQVVWAIKEPRRLSDDFQVEDIHVAVLRGGRIITGTTSWIYNFNTSKWESRHRFTEIGMNGLPAGPSKVFQVDNPSGMPILSMARGKAGNLLVSTYYVDSLVGRFRPYYPAVFSYNAALTQVEARYYAYRDGAKSFAPNSNLAVDPSTGDMTLSMFITDTVTGSNVPIWQGYLRIHPDLRPKRVKTLGLGYLGWPSANQARYFGNGRLGMVIGLGNDSSHAIVFTDTAGNGCTAYTSGTVESAPLPGTYPPISESYAWESVATYQGGANPLYTASLEAIPTCNTTVQPLRRKRLGRDTTVCGASFKLRWPRTACCRVFWSTGETTPEIEIYQTSTIIVRDIGDCSGNPEADTIRVTFSSAGGASIITPSAQFLCPGDTALLVATPRGPNAIFHWSNNQNLPMFDTTSAQTGLVVPYSLPPDFIINVTLLTDFDSTCTYTSRAVVGVLPLPTGTLATSDSTFFFADTRDSVASWTIHTGIYVPGPIRNSIRVMFDSLYGDYEVLARIVNKDGCDTVLTYGFTRIKPVVPPDTVIIPKLPYGQFPHIPFPMITNIVTPNADGKNDVFEFRDLGAEPYNLNVYSKWGRLIYRSGNYQQDFPNNDVPGGQYFYRLLVEGKAYTGWLEVVR